KALALKPADRYQAVDDLRRDIERFQEGRAVSAKQDTPWETAVKLVKRNKGFSLATGISLAVLSGVLAVAFHVNFQARLDAEAAQQIAEQHLSAFESEQQAKNDAIKKSIPGTLRAARQLANDGALPEALAQIALVRTYEPQNVEASLLTGLICVGTLDWKTATIELDRYLQLQPNQAEIVTLRKLVATKKSDDGPTLLAVAKSLQEQQLWGLARPLLSELTRQVELRKPLHALYEKQIKSVWPDVWFKLESDGSFSLGLNTPTSLEPLRGLPLHRLDVDNGVHITTLEPLRGMPLTHLKIYDAQITDLEPLRGMALNDLILRWNAPDFSTRGYESRVWVDLAPNFDPAGMLVEQGFQRGHAPIAPVLGR
ncbi:MAG: hypothetical protein JNM18_20470, partial [Planctomycetaceae bacterium]|nr:hypothetical protein [Planctomycetaceae bacterium]